MNFTINQTNGIRETVNSEFINKLYNLFITNRGLHTISLSGYLYSPTGYKALMDALNQLYGPDLVIEIPAAGLYILFQDPEVGRILMGTVSTDGIGVSEEDCALITSFNTLGLTNNSSIISFDELKYFTNITSIPQGGLSGTSNITEINLKNILSIGLGVFDGKTLLNNVGQTTNLRTIGRYAFKDNSSLHNIDLTGVTTIELEAFRGAGIIDVNCPNLLNLNGSGNFQMSSVQTITDLGNVTVLPDSAFWKCTSLTSVNIPNIITINNGVFSECSSLTGKLNLPNCTKIGWRALNETSITELYTPSLVIVGNTVNSTNPNNSRLVPTTCTKVTVSPNVTTIHTCAFANIPNLVLNASDFSTVTSLGGGAFLNCGLTGIIDMPNLASYITQTYYSNALSIFLLTNITEVRDLGLVTTLVPSMFKLCTSLTKVTLPSGIGDISTECFKDCTSLAYLVCPKGLYWGSENGFSGCSALSKIQINDLGSWYTKGSNRYDNGFPLTCNNLTKQLYDSNGNHITNLVLPEGITTCSNLNSGRTCKAFNRTDITSVTLPSTITELGGFTNCTSLASIDFSNTSSLTTFLQNAFIGCTSLNLDLANLPNSITSLGWNSFGNNPLVHGDINLPNLIGGLGLFVSYTDGNMGIISFSNLGSITSIDTDALRGLVGKVKFIVLPSTLTSFSGRNFKVNQYMLCLATTPPTQVEYGWDANNIPYCFVPDASLSAYLSSSAWSSLNLHGMSEFSSLATLNGWDLPTT